MLKIFGEQLNFYFSICSIQSKIWKRLRTFLWRSFKAFLWSFGLIGLMPPSCTCFSKLTSFLQWLYIDISSFKSDLGHLVKG